nr:MAG: polyprotein [XiangYun picorna-like virus 1]
MVVSMVKGSGIVAKMRAGVKTGVGLVEMRSMQRYRSLCARSAARRKFLDLKKSKLLAQRQRRAQRKAFFERNDLSKLRTVAATPVLTKEVKTHINTIVSINKKKISRSMLRDYRYTNGKFITYRMARLDAMLERRETRRFYAQQARKLRRDAKRTNIFGVLRNYEAADFSPLLSDLEDYLPDSFGHRLVLKKKVDFNPQQNFVYKSKQKVAAHPYAKMPCRERLHKATLANDSRQLTLLRKYRNKLEELKIEHAISYRNKFVAACRANNLERACQFILAFDNKSDLYAIVPTYGKQWRKRNNQRLRKNCAEQVVYEELYATPQMENDGAHGEDVVQIQRTQNVILAEAREPSTSTIERIPRWHKMNTEDVIGSFPEMVDRWYIMDKIHWTTSGAKESKLKVYHLPNFVFNVKELTDLISLRPFYNHRLWRGDMEIRIDVNSNKFQVGQLQCSFYYGLRDLAFSTRYRNTCTLSQCNHALIDAGGSNSAVLTIPFKNQSPMIATAPVGDIPALYIGSLCIFILNKLRAPAGVPEYADIVINFRFKNCEFSGQIPSGFTKIPAIPEMEALAMAGAMRLLDTAMADRNRDNPPAVLPPAYVVPTGSHSWSIGTQGAEPLHTLRLDQSGQTHHPVGTSIDSHNTVHDIVRIFSYVQQIEWKKATKAGEKLYNVAISPDYVAPKEIAENRLQISRVSAMRVMSSLFMQWRGSIEYRFDIVASQFHTGRLMVAFLPMYHSNSATIYDALSCPNIQFDLQEGRSFTFVVPYVHVDAWMRRQAQMDGFQSSYVNYGSLYIFVVNQLNCPDTVTDVVDINFYERAGSSFELSVPVQPSLGLSFITDVRLSGTDLFPEADGQTDAYLGFWSSEQTDKVLYIRWGTLGGRVAEFPNFKYVSNSDEWHYFTFVPGLEVTYVPNGAAVEQHITVTTYQIIQWNTYYVAVACKDVANAMLLLEAYRAAPKNVTWTAFALNATKIVKNPYFGRPIVLTRQIGQAPVKQDGFEMVMATGQGERENSEIPLDVTRSLMNTGYGRYMFGESFMELKDLCRRYQHYAKLTWDPEVMEKVNEQYMVRIPIIPTGMDLVPFHDGMIDMLSNKCRDGMIPIILSAFRFYRGSIRFRFVLHDNDSNGTMWVQHRPEMVNENSITYVKPKQDNLPMLAHGYASYVQCTSINDVLEIEVPFYQPGMYGLLGKPKSDSHRIYATNGILLLGMRANFSSKTHMTVHYCLGDDFDFNTFQGFPDVVSISGIAADPGVSVSNVMANPQSGDEEVVGNKAPWLYSLLGIGPMKDQIKADLQQSMETVMQTYREEGIWPGAKQFFMYVMSQVVHIITNPSTKTIVIAIIAILGYVGYNVYTKIDKITKFVKTVMRKFFPEQNELLKAREDGSSDEYEDASDEIPGTSDANRKKKSLVNRVMTSLHMANPEDEIGDDKENVAGWFSICFTAMTTALGCHDKGLKFDCAKAANEFLSAKHLKAGSAAHTFVKLNYRVLLQMFEYVRRKMDPEFYITKIFKKDTGVGQRWLTEARELLAIPLTCTESFSSGFSDRVDCALHVGRILMDEIASSNIDSLIRQLDGFEKRFTKLNKLRIDLNQRGQYSYRRPKPLHIQLHGAPGKGKTVLTDKLSDVILTEVCRMESIPINKICSVKASSKFWDQCTGSEPVVLLDDLWACNLPDILSNQVTNYIELYGDTIFSPPKANVDEKNMRYAPQLIISTTNRPWVALPGVEMDAIWRRMDVLVEVDDAPLDPIGHPACEHCRGESIGKTSHTHLSDFHHLKFRICNPLVNEAYYDDLGTMTWPQLQNYLLRELRPIYKKNHEMYTESVRRAMENANEEFEIEADTVEVQIEKYRDRQLLALEAKYTSLYEDFGPFIDPLKNRLVALKKHMSNSLSIVTRYLPTAKAEDEVEWPFDIPDSELRTFVNRELYDLCKVMNAEDHKTEINIIETAIVRMRKRRSNGKCAPALSFDYIIGMDSNGGCGHMTTAAVDGAYIRDENGCDEFSSVRSYNCKVWCVCNSELFMPLYRYTWVNAKPHRRILVRNKKFNLLPIFCTERDNVDVGFATRIKNVVLNSIDSQLMHDSPLRKLFAFIKYCFKAVFGLILQWLPIILTVLSTAGTMYAAYRKYKQHKSYSSWLDGERDEIQLNAVEHVSTFGAHLDEVQKNSWIAAYTSNELNKRIAAKAGKTFEEFQYAHSPPTGTIAFPEYNHYAGDRGRVPRIVGKQSVPKMAKAEAGTQQLLVAQDRLKKNAVWIRTRYINEKGEIAENKFLCTMLRAQQMLSIRHYWERWQSMPKDTEFFFSYVEQPERMRKLGVPDGALGLKINILECDRYILSYEDDENGKPLNDCNWDVIELPKQIEMAPDITKFFANRAQHAYVTGNIYFVRPGESCTHNLPLLKNPHVINMAPVPGGKVLTMQESYLYGRHAPGYCGSGILCGSLERPIIGFHVAEWNGKGCAEPIYGEVFNTKPTPENPVVDICEMKLLDVSLAEVDIDAIIYPKGVVPQQLATQQSGETQFVPSLRAGKIFEVTTAPMPLRSSDPRIKGQDPMKLGCEKHGKLPKDFPRKYLKLAVEDLKNKIITMCKPVRAEVGKLSLQQAICGDPNVPMFTALNWSSSEGFPLSSMRPPGKSGKQYLFDLRNTSKGFELLGMNPELMRLISQQNELRRRGIRPDTVFINCLKDETREIQKCNIPGKTRVFSTSPIQYIIPFRQYFGDFLAAYKNSRIHTEHAIGINEDGPEWTELANYLQQHGKNVIAGDYKHFGDSLNNNVMAGVFEIINAWYDYYTTSLEHEEEQIMRGVLASEAMSVKRLIVNLIYQALCGMASGFPATDVVNGMVNCIYIRIAWLILTLTTMKEFNQNNALVTYGDDILDNVSDEYAEIFNTKTISELFAKFDIIFTDCDKDGEIVPLRTLETATFLKRGFKKNPVRPRSWLAPINENSIGNCLNWVNSKDDPKAAFITNCEASLNLAYGHGPEYYGKLREILRKEVAQLGEVFLSLSWHEFDARAFKQANPN